MCRNPGEVLLLLVASDAIAFDLTEAYDSRRRHGRTRRESVTDVSLHLRRWRDVRPALEFRLFVRDGDLVGMPARLLELLPVPDRAEQKDTLRRPGSLLARCRERRVRVRRPHRTRWTRTSRASTGEDRGLQPPGRRHAPAHVHLGRAGGEAEETGRVSNETTLRRANARQKIPGDSRRRRKLFRPREKGFRRRLRVPRRRDPGPHPAGRATGRAVRHGGRSPRGALAAFAERQREAQERRRARSARGGDAEKHAVA